MLQHNQHQFEFTPTCQSASLNSMKTFAPSQPLLWKCLVIKRSWKLQILKVLLMTAYNLWRFWVNHKKTPTPSALWYYSQQQPWLGTAKKKTCRWFLQIPSAFSAPWCICGFTSVLGSLNSYINRCSILNFCLSCESADCISPVIRMALWKPGLQNEWHGARDLRVSFCLHSGRNRCWQVQQLYFTTTAT